MYDIKLLLYKLHPKRSINGLVHSLLIHCFWVSILRCYSYLKIANSILKEFALKYRVKVPRDHDRFKQDLECVTFRLNITQRWNNIIPTSLRFYIFINCCCGSSFTMEKEKATKRIAIVGGGPSGLFIYKRLIESGNRDFNIAIFEKKQQLGAGMPYSNDGANEEHITNVSANEIPHIVTSVEEWLQTVSKETLSHFNIDPKRFNEYKVLPRLLFGQYLSAQFDLLKKSADKAAINTAIYLNSQVTDIVDQPEDAEVWVKTEQKSIFKFDTVIISTGHYWPRKYEGTIPDYYDSPYPPAKLASNYNHPVAIKGASLTAIDAIRTLARHNGKFTDTNGKLSFEGSDKSPQFRLVMHSRNGLLPAVRFHLEDTHLLSDSLLTPEEITAHIVANGHFLSLDFIFEKDFKAIFRDKDPEFYESIKDMTIEEFVDSMMQLRERLDPFVLLQAEYIEAEKSIKRRQSVYWKEMLAVLSFAMNYPAKYFSAEDMLRLQKALMPLISIVIAFVPQASCRELMALHNAGVLELVAVGDDSTITPQKKGGATYHYTDENGESHAQYYKTFMDCVGQPHLSYEDFPFESLLKNRSVSPARLRFRSAEEGKSEIEAGNKKVEQDPNGDYFLSVPGIAINDNFQIIDQYGAFNSKLFIMAVPYIGGFNPDYSGLDFCEAASKRIVESLFRA